DQVRQRHDEHDGTGEAADEGERAKRVDVAGQDADARQNSERGHAHEQVDDAEYDVQPAEDPHVFAQFSSFWSRVCTALRDYRRSGCDDSPAGRIDSRLTALTRRITASVASVRLRGVAISLRGPAR